MLIDIRAGEITLLAEYSEYIDEVREVIGGISFRLKDISEIIQIIVSFDPEMNQYFASQNYYIQTPTQLTPHRTSRNFDETPKGAIEFVLQAILPHYREAVDAGHTPNENWLVK